MNKQKEGFDEERARKRSALIEKIKSGEESVTEEIKKEKSYQKKQRPPSLIKAISQGIKRLEDKLGAEGLYEDDPDWLG